ncbi:MAG TPA: hypothetical protein ENJ56_00730 [Anaerolineae bacterium]|nr:hypothetical protein [Anaerolineae bacterium]
MLRLIILRTLESYFRRPLLSLLPILILTIAGGFFLYNKEDEFISGGQISIRGGESVVSQLTGLDGESSIWTTPAETTVEQFSELIASESFMRAIIAGTEYEAELANPDTDRYQFFGILRKNVWSDVVGPKTISVGATADSPETAQQLATNLVNAFLNWNTASDLVDAETSVKFFEDSFEKENAIYDQAQAELQAYLIANPEPVRGERTDVQKLEIARLTAVANDAAARVTDQRAALDTARLAYEKAKTDTEQKYRLMDRPGLPDKSLTTKKGQAITLAIFMVIGGLMGLVGVFGSAFLDRTFRYPIDIRESLELPVLGVVPEGTIIEPQPMPAFANGAQAAPPPVYRSKLTPNVEPPTLIIMPGEKAELEKIALERNQHGTKGKGQQLVPAHA